MIPTQSGDRLRLGRHWLLCGDSTSTEDVLRLFDRGEGSGYHRVDMLLTDPPYGADLVEKWESAKRMQGGKEFNARRDGCAGDAELTTREISDYRVFFASFLRRVPWGDPNSSYIFMSSKHLHDLRLAMEDTDMHTSDNLIWLKSRIVPGRRDYHSKYETIAYGWKGRHAFYGARHQANVLEHKRASRNAWHPCQKPLDLVTRLVRNGSPPTESAIVYDPFCGGGTTILACEAVGRTCFAMEVEPSRCDSIRARWEQRDVELAKLQQEAAT